MTIEWFRHKHGLSTDPKLRFIGTVCNVSVTVVVTLWCYMLEKASANRSNRGKLDTFDIDEAAFFFDLNRTDIERIIAEMHKRHMIDDDGVTHWDDHQFPADHSTDRVKRFRERQRNVSCNGSETLHATEIEREKEIEIKIEARAKRARTDRDSITSKRVREIDDLTIDDELRTIAKAEARDPDRELASFKDHCTAKGRAYKDYRAAFRNWLRSEYGKPKAEPGKPSADWRLDPKQMHVPM